MQQDQCTRTNLVENVSDTMANPGEKAVVMMVAVMVEKERLGRRWRNGQQSDGHKNTPTEG